MKKEEEEGADVLEVLDRPGPQAEEGLVGKRHGRAFGMLRILPIVVSMASGKRFATSGRS